MTDNTPKITGKKKIETKYFVNVANIVSHSRSQVPPFLLTFENFNFNVYNCLEYFGASSNVIPYLVFQKINVVLENRTTRII
jgi:hypothetical protein